MKIAVDIIKVQFEVTEPFQWIKVYRSLVLCSPYVDWFHQSSLENLLKIQISWP